MTANLTPNDYLELPDAPPDARIAYGDLADQYGELFMPQTPPPSAGYPCITLLHGGCWRQAFGAAPMRQLARAVAALGFAVWNLEYSRLGGAGGWPRTFLDVGRGADFVRDLASGHPIDLDRVAVAGHSAGGHLALWLGTRLKLAPGSELHVTDPLPPRAIVSFAGIGNLADALERGICRGAPDELMGGDARAQPERYRQGSPHQALPLGIPQWHIVGTEDTLVMPAHVRDFVAAAIAAGDRAELVEVDGAGHFEIVAAGSYAWPRVRDVLTSLPL